MAALVPRTRQVPALLPASQPLQLAVLHTKTRPGQTATSQPAQQPWRPSRRRQRWRAGRAPPARFTAAAALSRPSIEERLAVALDTPAAKELGAELAAAVAFIESTGASANMAFLIAKEAGRLPPDQCRAALATLQPKFRAYQQRCGGAAGTAAVEDACDYLAIALIGCPSTQAALALPLADFEAALNFIASQAALLPNLLPSTKASPSGMGAAAAAATAAAAEAAGVSPAAVAALAEEAAAAAAAAAAASAAARAVPPAPFYLLFKRHSLMLGALLQQHPAPFLQHAAPWLQAQLGWSDADVAAAALLSGRMPQLCQLDTHLAQASLDWLLAQGLSQQQAGQLLLVSLRRQDADLLTASQDQLAERQQRVVQLARQWGVPPGLAAALWLTQGTHMGSGREEDTGRLVAVLRGEVGMSDAQLLQFALRGGLRGDQAARQTSLNIALLRLKRLLLVCGSWAGVAAALERCPGLLFADDAAVEGLLPEPAQRAMWQVVAQMEAGS